MSKKAKCQFNLFFLFLFITQILQAQVPTNQWEGTTNNQWSEPSNWSQGHVPTADERARILNTSTDPIIANGVNAVAIAVYVDNNAKLTIQANGTLTINGQDNATYNKGIFNDGEIINSGTIEITETEAACLFNQSDFQNQNTGVITLSGGSAGINNHGTHNGSVTGDFHNRGSITITDVNIGIHNDASTFRIYGNGQVTIDNTNGIGFDNQGFSGAGGNIFNQGTVEIGLAGPGSLGGTGVNNRGVFNNAGDLHIKNGGGAGIFNVIHFGNNASGLVTINDITGNGVVSQGFGTFGNAGTFKIGNTGTIGKVGIKNSGAEWGNSGLLEIDRTTEDAIEVFGFGDFENTSTLKIGQKTNNSIGENGIEYHPDNTGLKFKNTGNGTIYIDNTAGHGINNYGNKAFENLGNLIIGSMGNNSITGDGINNAVGFRNEGCGHLQLPKDRLNNSGTFNNKGLFSTFFNGQHLNTGTINNDGVIEDFNDSFNGVSINNNDIIVSPLPPSACTINPALQIGADNSFTVSTDWYVDPNMNQDGGDYDQANNIFTGAAGLGTHTMYMNISQGNCNHLVSIELTLTADNTAPNAQCKNNQTFQVDVNGDVFLSPSDIDNGSTDNCGIFMSSVTPDHFDCTQLGSHTVTLMVADGDGNQNSCQANITISDTNFPCCDAPMALCQDFDAILDANGQVIINTGDIDGGSTADCGLQNLDIDVSSFDCAQAGTVQSVTLTITDILSNSDNCTANVSVIDNSLPQVACLNPTIQLDNSGNYQLSENEVFDALNSMDNCGTVSFVMMNPASIDCSNTLNPVSVTVWAEDANGNQNTCTATVTVEDNTPPIALCNDLTIALDNQGAASITVADIDNGSNDACGIASTFLDKDSFDCNDILSANPHLVTLTVIDNNNNTASCNSNVTVEDNTPPTAMCNDLTIELNSQGLASITTTEVDNGSNDACGIASLALNSSDFDCSDILGAGPHTVTLTVTDVSNNTSNCTASITVEDNIIPSALCQDLSIELDANGNQTITSTQIDNGSNDNCGQLSYNLSKSTFDCSDVGNNSITLTVTDLSGNSHTCNANVHVSDNVDPIAICQNVSVNLDENGMGSLSPPMVDNGSNDACGINSLSISQENFDCNHLGNNLITLTVQDVNGNAASCMAIVTVIDPLAPVILCSNNVNSSSDPDICGSQSVNLNQPFILAENCSIASITNNAPSLYPIGASTVTWEVTDIGGNTSTCEQKVVIQDFTPPQITCGIPFTTNVTADQCSFPSTLLDEPTVSDNCGIASITNDAPAFFEIGNYVVTWTITDIYGNASICTQNAKIRDFLSAEFTNCPELIEVEAENENGATVFWNEIIATDNCGDVFLVPSHESGDVFPIGETTVSILAYDGYSAPSECTFIVSVGQLQPALNLTCLDELDISVVSIDDWDAVAWNPPFASSSCEDCPILEGENFHHIGDFFGHQYYIYENDDLNWKDAKDFAEGIGANLLILNHPQELHFILNEIDEIPYFIGISDEEGTGTYHWVDDELAEDDFFGEGFFDNTTEASTIIINENGEWEIAPLFGTMSAFIFEFTCIDIQMEVVVSEESTFPAPNSNAQIIYNAFDLCGNSAICGFNVNLSTQVVDYCEEGSFQEGTDPHSWIEVFALNTESNDSGNDFGYADFTNQPLFVESGVPTFIGSKFQNSQNETGFFCRIWVDFNQDGDFYDENELILEEIYEEQFEENYTFPEVNSPMQTRIRIAISNQFFPEPCGSYANGEVEDYTIVLTEPQISNLNANLQIFPNPAQQNAYLNLEEHQGKNATIRIFNNQGIQVMEQSQQSISKANLKLNLRGLKDGLYLISLDIPGEKRRTERMVVSNTTKAVK